MAELSDLYVNLLNQASDPMRGYRAMQDQQVRNMELQNKQREFAAEQQLRELFAQNASPNISQIGAISPQFAQTFGKNQMEMMQAGMGMQNIQSQMDERAQKRIVDESRIRAFAFAPLAEQYKREVDAIGEAQASKNYNEGMGKTASALQAAGINIPMNFNPEQATPDAVLYTAVGFGFPSEFLKGQASLANKAAEERMPQRHVTPEGYTMIVPGIPPQSMVAQPAEVPQGAQQVPIGNEDRPALEQLYKKLPTGRFKDEVGQKLAAMSQAPSTTPARPAAMPPAQFMTPQQIQQNRIENKAAEETATKQAAQTLEDQRSIDSYFRGRPPEQIRQLIKESIAGDVESGVARIAKTFGVSVPGGAPTAALEVITQQLASSSPFAPGSQSDVEYKARLKKIGDPASNEPAENRLMALDEFYRDQEAFVAQKYEPKSMADILDKRHKGYISDDTARELFRKMKAKKSGAM